MCCKTLQPCMLTFVWPLHKFLTDARVRCRRKTVIQEKYYDFMQIRLIHTISLMSCGRKSKPIALVHWGIYSYIGDTMDTEGMLIWGRRGVQGHRGMYTKTQGV